MDTTTATKTADDYRAEAAAHRQAEVDSFDRCDTDGFASQAASGIMARKASLDADIAEQGGRWTFPALFDLDGNLVAAKLITTRYGTSWGVLESDDPDSRIVAWVGRSYASKAATRNRNMAKKGYSEGMVKAPARADLGGGGRGFAGMASVTVYAKRIDGGFSRTVEIVETTETKDF